VVVLELGVAEVAPCVLPEVVESLFDSDVELGFVPLSAERLHDVVPSRSVEPRMVLPMINVSFRVFIVFFLRLEVLL
jgi:hypothetical protein